MRRLLPLGFACIYAVLPLFPAFISLTSVAYPGVSVVSPRVVFAILGSIVLLAVYAAAMLLRYPRRGSQPLLVPLLAWIVCAAVSTFAGFDPLHGLLFLGLSAMGILWHCALVRFYGEPHVPAAIFGSYLLSGGLAAAAAVAMVVARVPISLYALQHGRATGTFILPGELAAYLVVLLPIAFTLARIARTAAMRALAWSTTAIGLIALAMTFSRAGWIGFACAAAVVAAARFRYRRRRGVAIAVAVTAVLLVALLFNSHHDPSEDYTRLAIWQGAIAVIDRFPLTGVGPFDFPRLYALVHVPDADATAFHAHSLYLTLFAELGILGLAAFLACGWRFAVELRARVARSVSNEATLLALAAAAGLAGVAVQGLIDTVSIVIFGLWMPTMGLALAVAQSGAPPADPGTA